MYVEQIAVKELCLKRLGGRSKPPHRAMRGSRALTVMATADKFVSLNICGRSKCDGIVLCHNAISVKMDDEGSGHVTLSACLISVIT